MSHFGAGIFDDEPPPVPPQRPPAAERTARPAPAPELAPPPPAVAADAEAAAKPPRRGRRRPAAAPEVEANPPEPPGAAPAMPDVAADDEPPHGPERPTPRADAPRDAERGREHNEENRQRRAASAPQRDRDADDQRSESLVSPANADLGSARGDREANPFGRERPREATHSREGGNREPRGREGHRREQLGRESHGREQPSREQHSREQHSRESHSRERGPRADSPPPQRDRFLDRDRGDERRPEDRDREPRHGQRPAHHDRDRDRDRGDRRSPRLPEGRPAAPLSRLHSDDRVAVFVDLDALQDQARQQGGEVAFRKLLRAAAGTRKVTAAVCYHGTTTTAGTLRALQAAGFELRPVTAEQAAAAMVADAAGAIARADVLVLAPCRSDGLRLRDEPGAGDLRIEAASFDGNAPSGTIARPLGRECLFLP